MKHCVLAISIIIGIVPNLVAQNYRLQIAVYEHAMGEDYFASIKGDKKLVHEVDNSGFHRYYLEGFSYLEEVQKVELEALNGNFRGAQIIEIVPTASPEVVNNTNSSFISAPQFEPIFFDSNRYRVKSVAREKLKQLAIYLKANPAYNVRLEGHTDSAGDPKMNDDLSRERARATRDYLVEMGIDSYRLFLDVYGESRPIAINLFLEDLDAPEGRAYNRRVDFVIFNESGYTISSTATDANVPLELRIREDERLQAQNKGQLQSPANAVAKGVEDDPIN